MTKENIYRFKKNENQHIKEEIKNKTLIDTILKSNQDSTNHELPDPTDLIREDRDRKY